MTPGLLQAQSSLSRSDVMRLTDACRGELAGLLSRLDLRLEHVAAGRTIEGSYWGDEEAGLIGRRLIARPDTPLHSILHEACHYACMDEARRNGLHTDAGGGYLEECAVCYLQIKLADLLPSLGASRMMEDMDRWGYTFRLGSTRAWFENDADDALAWLQERGLVDHRGNPTFQLRGTA